MYKNCRTIESATRQREFENCLLHTMKNVPYENISVTDLCAQVGIARKNFYRYFENKDDVLCALIDHTLLDYTQFKSFDAKNSPDGTKEILEYLSYWQLHKPLLDVLEKNRLSTKLIERVLIHAWQADTGFLQLLHAKGNIYDPNNVLFAVSGIITLIVTWHHGGYEESKEQLATTIHQLLTQPIVNM